MSVKFKAFSDFPKWAFPLYSLPDRSRVTGIRLSTSRTFNVTQVKDRLFNVTQVKDRLFNVTQ